MKHLIVLVTVAFALTSVTFAQTDTKTTAKDKAKTAVQQKTAVKTPDVKPKMEKAAKTAAKPEAAKESLPAGAMLDLNTATKSDLMKLPGIGEAYADKIIKGRPYTRKDELVSKKIISKKIYDPIKESLVANRVK